MAASVKDDTITTNRRLKTEKKKTILTGDQRHINDITKGQRASRHSLQTQQIERDTGYTVAVDDERGD